MIAQTSHSVKLEFEAIGTAWKIELDAPADNAGAIAKEVADLIRDFDHNYSRFLPDSWIINAGNNPGSHKAPADFEPIFSFYKQMYLATNGLVTPLIGDAMERAGYDANYSLRPKELKEIPGLNKVLQFKDNTLHVKYKCTIDLGAAGKGYLVDLVGNLLAKQGIDNYLINAGGDILQHSPASSDSTPVGLENPDDPSEAIGVSYISNRAICGSAGNRRAWEGYNHVINPSTLESVTIVKASWVVADTAMVADGLATCLFFVEPSQLANLSKLYNFEYIRVMEDNNMQISPNFPGKLFSKQS